MEFLMDMGDGSNEVLVYDYGKVPPMEMMFGRTLLFSCDGRHYEIESDSFRALKYVILHSMTK